MATPNPNHTGPAHWHGRDPEHDHAGGAEPHEHRADGSTLFSAKIPRDNLDPRPRGVTDEPQALTAADRAGVVRDAIIAQHGPIEGEITQHSILCSAMHIPSENRPPAQTCRECALERRATEQAAALRALGIGELAELADADDRAVNRIIRTTGFQWIQHVDALNAHDAAHGDEIKALRTEIHERERALWDRKHRAKWLEGLKLVRAGLAEIRFRPQGTRSILGVYLRDPESPTRVSMYTAACDCPAHEAEARAAGRVYASASLG